MVSKLRPMLIPLDVAVAASFLPASAGTGARRTLDQVLGGTRVAAQLTVATPSTGVFAPGQPVPVKGELATVEVTRRGVARRTTGAGSVSLRVRTPDGRTRGPWGPFRTDAQGRFSTTLPAAATAGLTGTLASPERTVVAVEAVDAKVGKHSAAAAGVAAVAVAAAATTGLQVENSFVSSVGWVKPNETYPWRVLVRNYDTAAKANVKVTLASADGMRFTEATPTSGSGTASHTAASVTWTVGSIPAASGTGDELVPAIRTLVLEGRADSTEEDPQIVWKDLSTTAQLTYDGGTGSSRSHGPKVIPPSEQFESARYGDRPFPVVPVDYFDLGHHPTNSTADKLDGVINQPSVAGSTFNLYQEMSLKQLFPQASVPSVGIATRDFQHEFTNPKYADGFDFTAYSPPADQSQAGTCVAATDFTLGNTPAVVGSPAFNERIKDGWYKMPGTVGYYGRDKYGSALVGAVGGVGLLFNIDSACGDTGKAVYDAAHIADPEIDYSDFDTDKDGVVDFFMLVYSGKGGHGESQLQTPATCDPVAQPLDCASYDNIWPHSSSLEFGYEDPETGLTGYITDDQLKDLEGRPLFYTTERRTEMTTTTSEFPVYVRVGPYNVNPESAIAHASVISHEYGHSLGLPDYYSSGSRETYGDWSLMATDKSHNIDVIGKKELGWIIPKPIPDGTSTVNGWKDSKVDTHAIHWQTKTGTPYTLSGPDVHNAEAYVASLPGRRLVDREKVAQGASPTHIWWSGSGSDFGCAPEGGHNLDVALPELADIPEGTSVTLTFNSYWDIEWDWDYGYVLIANTDDEGALTDYSSVPSENGYTTPGTNNPNAIGCHTRYGNGITGTSGSYDAGTTEQDRRGLSSQVPGGTDYPDGPFLPDEYDISSLAGKSGAVLRFSYWTDGALARPGWFIDDLKITAGDQVIYQSDLEKSGDSEDPRIFNGGCKENVKVADNCTAGWIYAEAGAESPAEHAYQLEMRDRSGFDVDGKGQNDRDPINFSPGTLLTYTNEAMGYGNTGQNNDAPPTQSPLDAAPTPGDATPALNDAAFTEGDVYNDSGAGHTDNYIDTTTESDNWEFRFNCLGFKVLSMTGDDIGPAAVGGADTLTGSVQFTTKEGCVPYNYGYEGDDTSASNAAPVAVAQAKPTKVTVGQPVTFDGSASHDDTQGAATLKYEWDFDGNGTYDATGQRVSHAYAKEGRYIVRLRVTDAQGLTSTTTVTVQVGPVTTLPRPPVTEPPLPATGPNGALAGLALLAAGTAAMTWRLRRTGAPVR